MSDRRSVRGPLDLLLVYITPSNHGVGQRLTMASIESRLRRLPLRPVLRLLAITAHLADRSVRSRQDRVELACQLMRPGPARNRAVELIQQGSYAFVASQTALVLAQHALRDCPDIESACSDEDLGFQLGELLIALADHLGHRSHSQDELLLELVRLGLFYRLNGIGDWYSAAHGLFFETLPSLSDDHEYIDVGELFESELGISLETYWAVSASVGVVSLGDRQLHVYPKQIGAVPRAFLDAWFATQTQTIDEARLRAVRDLRSGSPWALETFFLRPIIEAVGPDGNYPMRSQLLALKATVVGMYYLVFDLLRSRGSDDHLRWSRFFGRVVETYGRSLLQTYINRNATLSFPDAARTGPLSPPACDFLVEDSQAIVAGDFVHRSLTLATQTSGTPADLERDLSFAIVEKVRQIDATLARTLYGRVERLYPVVVMSGPLPMNPSVAAKIGLLVAAAERLVVGMDERCRPVTVLEIHELKMLLLTASENGLRIADLIEAWRSSPLGDNNYREWLICQNEIRPGRSHEGDRWEERVYGIFGSSG